MRSEMGTCLYCGQMNQVSVEDGRMMTGEEIDKLATESCTCEEARNMQEKKEAKTQAQLNISALFSRDFPIVEEMLMKAVSALEAEEISSITVDTGKRVKAKVSLTSKGNIKVERTKTTKTSLES